MRSAAKVVIAVVTAALVTASIMAIMTLAGYVKNVMFDYRNYVLHTPVCVNEQVDRCLRTEHVAVKSAFSGDNDQEPGFYVQYETQAGPYTNFYPTNRQFARDLKAGDEVIIYSDSDGKQLYTHGATTGYPVPHLRHWLAVLATNAIILLVLFCWSVLELFVRNGAKGVACALMALFAEVAIATFVMLVCSCAIAQPWALAVVTCVCTLVSCGWLSRCALPIALEDMRRRSV